MPDTGVILTVEVCLDLSARNKQDLFDRLAKQAGNWLSVSPEVILRQLDAREKLGSTALGSGIAIPHAQVAGLPRPFVALVRLTHSIDFQARDEQPVDLVFVVLWPDGETKNLLATMAHLCSLVRAPDVARRIRRSPTPQAAVAILNGWRAPNSTP